MHDKAALLCIWLLWLYSQDWGGRKDPEGDFAEAKKIMKVTLESGETAQTRDSLDVYLGSARGTGAGWSM
jgi:hypothetical protein